MTFMGYEEGIEADIENAEGKIEESEQRMADVSLRLQAIESAIAQLGDDKEVAGTLEGNRESAESEKEDVQREREQIANELENLQNKLGEMENGNIQSESVISQLELLGEDDGDAWTVIQERQAQIQEHRRQIQALLDRLKLHG